MMDWISVDDRLPSKATTGEIRVLASGETRSFMNTLRTGIYICDYNPVSGDWILQGNYCLERVTHWQPLPDPPPD